MIFLNRKKKKHLNSFFESDQKALCDAIEAYAQNNWKRCRKALKRYFKELASSDSEYSLPSSVTFEGAVIWLEMMFNTGLNDSREGTPACIFFKNLVNYIRENLPPDIKKNACINKNYSRYR